MYSIKNNRTILLPALGCWDLIFIHFFPNQFFVCLFSYIPFSDFREEMILQSFTPAKGTQGWPITTVNLSYLYFHPLHSFPVLTAVVRLKSCYPYNLYFSMHFRRENPFLWMTFSHFLSKFIPWSSNEIEDYVKEFLHVHWEEVNNCKLKEWW